MTRYYRSQLRDGHRYNFIQILIFTLFSLILTALLFNGCSSRPTFTGYWEGKGKAKETMMSDGFRNLERSADFEFWFVLNKDGVAIGEMEIVYDALLKVENLPSVTAPVPGGNITFDPKVGGKLTDVDPNRTFPIVGLCDGKELTLAIAVEEDDRKPLEFTIRADPGVSAGFTFGGFGKAEGKKEEDTKSTVGLKSGGFGTIVHKIPMTPFSPFAGPAQVEKRHRGPYAAHREDKGKKYTVEWSARQMGGEQRKVEMTPELEEALERLRQH